MGHNPGSQQKGGYHPILSLLLPSQCLQVPGCPKGLFSLWYGWQQGGQEWVRPGTPFSHC